MLSTVKISELRGDCAAGRSTPVRERDSSVDYGRPRVASRGGSRGGSRSNSVERPVRSERRAGERVPSGRRAVTTPDLSRRQQSSRCLPLFAFCPCGAFEHTCIQVVPDLFGAWLIEAGSLAMSGTTGMTSGRIPTVPARAHPPAVGSCLRRSGQPRQVQLCGM